MEREDLETSLDKQASLHGVDPSRNLMPWAFSDLHRCYGDGEQEQCSSHLLWVASAILLF